MGKKKKENNETWGSGEVKGVRFGKYRGASGRRRDLFVTHGRNRQNEKLEQDYAYGRDGVKLAKKDIRKHADKRAGHRVWIKYYTYNRTKGRIVK